MELATKTGHASRFDDLSRHKTKHLGQGCQKSKHFGIVAVLPESVAMAEISRLPLGNLAKWLMGTSVVSAAPTTCYTHPAGRSAPPPSQDGRVG